MDDRAVSTVQTVLAETRWLPVPCPTEYLPALARDILWALEQAGIAVGVLPEPDDDVGGLTQSMWRVGNLTVETMGDAVLWPTGYTKTPGVDTHNGCDPKWARILAAALLAAAVAAESVSVVATPQEQP